MPLEYSTYRDHVGKCKYERHSEGPDREPRACELDGDGAGNEHGDEDGRVPPVRHYETF
jgi:hypothetical protein